MTNEPTRTDEAPPLTNPWFLTGIALLLLGMPLALSGSWRPWLGIPMELVGAVLIGLSFRSVRRGRDA